MPKAIFMVAAVMLFVSFVLVVVVRNPVHEKRAGGGKRSSKKRRVVERGRSRVSKDLRGGAAGFGSDFC